MRPCRARHDPTLSYTLLQRCKTTLESQDLRAKVAEQEEAAGALTWSARRLAPVPRSSSFELGTSRFVPAQRRAGSGQDATPGAPARRSRHAEEGPPRTALRLDRLAPLLLHSALALSSSSSTSRAADPLGSHLEPPRSVAVPCPRTASSCPSIRRVLSPVRPRRPARFLALASRSCFRRSPTVEHLLRCCQPRPRPAAQGRPLLLDHTPLEHLHPRATCSLPSRPRQDAQ